jgi:hypothetical protein
MDCILCDLGRGEDELAHSAHPRQYRQGDGAEKSDRINNKGAPA